MNRFLFCVLTVIVSILSSRSYSESIAVFATYEDLEKLGLLGGGKTDFSAGTVIVDSEVGSLELAYDDAWGVLQIANLDAYRTVRVEDSDDIILGRGVSGNSNPTFTSYEKGVMSAGAVFKIKAKKDGWMTVFTKMNPHKQYVVFDGETGAVPYTLGVAGLNFNINYTLPVGEDGYIDFGASDASKYFILAENEKGESLGHKPQFPYIVAGLETPPSESTGFLTFKVYADHNYYVSALGSKMSCGGFVFSDSKNEPIVTFAETDNLPEVTFKITSSKIEEQVPTPTANFENKRLTLSCSDNQAQIRYTTNGKEPSATSTLYKSPLSLTSDCTVKFFAIRQGYKDSDKASFVFRRSDYQVAKPTISYNPDRKLINITCQTEGAEIRYTIDGSVPTASTGTLYQNPVDVDGNMTFTAKAFRSDLFDSETTVYTVDNMKLPTPTASYGRHELTLSCGNTSADIHYTTDGSVPTESSALYTAPIALTTDCTVRFIATKERYISSDEGSHKFVLADWQEAVPTITKDFTGRKITISQANSLPVSVTIDGNTQTIQTPATIDVTPAMSILSALALAQDENRYNSRSLEDSIVFHKAPTLSYDGHTLRVALANGEPAIAAAERQLFVDGTLALNSTSDLSKDIDRFCSVVARVQSANAFISEPVEMNIDAYNTGRVAGVRNGHTLTEVVGTWGDNPADYDYLRIVGELSKSDMQTVAALPQLTTLHIEVDSIANDDYTRVLEGTHIETIFSSHYPKGMLIGMPRLTTVMWGNSEEAMPSGILTEVGNPNLLFWTPSLDMLPEDAFNSVEYEYGPNGAPTDPEGDGVKGHALVVLLHDGYPFKAHMPLVADYINFKKTFTLPTELNECAGWETIVLPFSTEYFSHERQGSIVPFATWDSSNPDPYAGEKPFWLYKANGNGWEEAKAIEAGVPYIISMPNNKEYVESYTLDGEVTFWTGEQVQLGTSDSDPKSTDWKDGDKFEGTYMPEEGTDIYSLNVNATDEGVYAGSEFVPGEVTLPFGAFMRSQSGRRAIPVFDNGGSNGIQLPTLSAGGFLVESPAPGVLRICSARSLHTAIFTPEGAKVKVLDLKAGETATAEGLTRGLYICGGVKIMVK